MSEISYLGLSIHLTFLYAILKAVKANLSCVRYNLNFPFFNSRTPYMIINLPFLWWNEIKDRCKFRLINATCTEWLHHRDGRNAPAWRRNCSTITARLLQPLFMSHHLFCTYNYAFTRMQDMTMFPNAAQQSLWIIGLWFKLQLKTELAASHPFWKLKR